MPVEADASSQTESNRRSSGITPEFRGLLDIMPYRGPDETTGVAAVLTGGRRYVPVPGPATGLEDRVNALEVWREAGRSPAGARDGRWERVR